METKGAHAVVLLLDAHRPEASEGASQLLAGGGIQHARVLMTGRSLPVIVFNGKLYSASSEEGRDDFLADYNDSLRRT